MSCTPPWDDRKHAVSSTSARMQPAAKLRDSASFHSTNAVYCQFVLRMCHQPSMCSGDHHTDLDAIHLSTIRCLKALARRNMRRSVVPYHIHMQVPAACESMASVVAQSRGVEIRGAVTTATSARKSAGGTLSARPSASPPPPEEATEKVTTTVVHTAALRSPSALLCAQHAPGHPCAQHAP